MDIKYNFSNVNFREGRNGRSIKAIILHDTGCKTSDTAKANANYFKEEYKGASAHYFIDENEIYQVVKEGNTAWHIGVANYGRFGNSDTIGIEMCITNGVVSEKTKKLTIQLVKELMSKYNIPIDNVLRHRDVCDTPCPSHINDYDWKLIKDEIQGIKKDEEDKYQVRVFTFIGKESAEIASKKITNLGYYNQVEKI